MASKTTKRLSSSNLMNDLNETVTGQNENSTGSPLVTSFATNIPQLATNLPKPTPSRGYREMSTVESPVPSRVQSVAAAEVSLEPDARKLDEAQKKMEHVSSRRRARAWVAANVGVIRISVVGDSGIGKVPYFSFLFAWRTLSLLKSTDCLYSNLYGCQ